MAAMKVNMTAIYGFGGGLPEDCDDMHVLS